MKEWIEKKLEDVARIIDYRGKTPKKTDSGIPLITAKIVKNGRIEKPNEFIAEEDYDKWMIRGLPESGDVVMTTEAPLGEVAQIRDNNVALAQRIITLRGAKNILDNGYLKYFLQSNEGQTRLKARETGTTVTGIKQSELRKVLIPMPEIGTQRAIAEILYSLDDKIELNNQINENLEALAQAIFKNLLEEYSENEPANIADYVNFNPPVKISKGKLVPFVEMKFLPTSGMNVTEVAEKAFSAGSRFEKNDTLLARITPCLENGKTAFVNFIEQNEAGFGSTEFIVMRAKDTCCPQFVYCLARDEKFRIHAIGSMVGSSGRQRVQQDMLLEFSLPSIPSDELKNFHLATLPIFEQISANRVETSSLIALRDLLLPKLIDGTIEI
jgi:type I restriction enzyme S subunit